MCKLCAFALRHHSLDQGNSLFLRPEQSALAATETFPKVKGQLRDIESAINLQNQSN